MVSIIVPSQAWAILKRHAHEEVAPLRLQELCRDEDRTTALIEVYQTDASVLILDLSRQRMTDTTMNHLLGLAVSMNLRHFIQQIAWGRNDPRAMESGAEQPLPRDSEDSSPTRDDPAAANIPSMHLAMRVPPDNGYEMFDGNKSILPEIHKSWERVESFANSVRSGHLRGATGLILKTVLVIGATPIPMTALRFLYTALQHDSVASKQQNAAGDRIRILTGSNFNRQLKVIDRVDPQHIASVLEEIDPASTLVVTIAVTGKEDTGMATKIIKGWLMQGLKNQRTEVAKHMILVTGNDRIASVIHKPEAVFVLPEYARCEAFLACSVATCLPLAITFGWSVVKEILAGAHDMDTHFVETNPRHNLPVLLALTDVWNDVLSGTNRCLKAGSFAFNDYSKYVAALEASTCREPSSVRSSTTPLVYDAETTVAINCEWVFAIDNQIGFTASKLGGSHDIIHDTQDSLVCDMLSTIDERALESNHPSAMLWCGRLNAFCCGQLLALAEHRSVVKAHIWGIDPFLRPPERRIEYISHFQRMLAQSENGEDDDRLNLATRTILGHYVSLVREARRQEGD
jgi:glucose-6-phosphate isomerase